MQAYSDPKRASDLHSLPDLEVFYIEEPGSAYKCDPSEPGWYWWACVPGCLPDSEPYGPFATEAEALANARCGMGCYPGCTTHGDEQDLRKAIRKARGGEPSIKPRGFA